MGKSRRRRNSSNFKFDTFTFDFEPPTITIEEYDSPSNFSSSKFLPVPDSDYRHWTLLKEGFPPGITVDQLKKYGRRRQPAHMIPQDNLRVEEGSLKPYKSEYTRRFQAYGPLNLKPISDKPTIGRDKSSYDDTFHRLPQNASTIKNDPSKRSAVKRPPVNLEPMKTKPVESSGEKNCQCLNRPFCDKRKLLRRSTALKPEGTMTNETEVRKEYRAYMNPERAHMVRRLPSLKVEGEFEPFTTEQQDKYVAYLLGKRPILEKKKTLLKMEGDFNFVTENNLSYVPHELSERPRLRKRSTSLKLDGELEFFPEYRESFVDYSRTRPITYKPYGTLRSDGELEKQTETKTQFVNYENVQVPESAKPENNLQIEGEMEIVPEYKQSYVDFPRERPFTRKPLNQIKPNRNLQVLSDNSERFGTELSSNETKKENANNSNSNNNITLGAMSDFVSEQNDKFRKHDSPEKTELFKMAPNLKLEGEMNFVTEKADKYGALWPDQPEQRPLSLKLNADLGHLSPGYGKSYPNLKSFGTPLKPPRNFRSNPTSPRRKPKERIKFNLEEDKKFILGTPSRRLNENSRPAEKSLKFDLPLISPSKMREGPGRLREDFDYLGKTKRSDSVKLNGAYLGKADADAFSAVPKKFQAFHVLDVKGQLGCQAMRKDVLESTSEDENSTFRLEVSNPETGTVFPGRDTTLFPPPTIASGNVTRDADKHGRKPLETYEKIVRSPEVANYLLEENNVESDWKTPGKLSPSLTTDVSNKRAFVVLNGSHREHLAKETSKKEKNDWEPDWMSASPVI